MIGNRVKIQTSKEQFGVGVRRGGAKPINSEWFLDAWTTKWLKS
jgi:hypothetical protein